MIKNQPMKAKQKPVKFGLKQPKMDLESKDKTLEKGADKAKFKKLIDEYR